MDLLKLSALTVFLFLSSCSSEYVRPENYQNPQISIDTDLGSIVCELYEDKVPNTVANFISLAESGFYNDMLFHFIKPGVFVQGGCPNTKMGAKGRPGSGDAGYLIKEEIVPGLQHDSRGILTMAKQFAPNTTGSQFAIMLDKLPSLDGKQTVFGKVVKGQEVLDFIEKMGSEKGFPKREIVFSIKVLRKNDIEYKFHKIEK